MKPKIMFAGCSFVMGDEVERHERFSHIVCEALNAEELNIASGGRSNALSVALVVAEARKHNPDYIVFGLSYPTRAFGLWNEEFDKLAFWNDNNVFVDNSDVTFKISANMSGYKHTPPDHKQIEQALPHYRNSLQTYIETQGILAILEKLSRDTQTPVCVFQATDPTYDIPNQLNSTELKDTIFQHPPKSSQWLDVSLYEMAIANNDMMPRNHPGARTHKEFAEILADKIRKEI